MPAAAAPAEYCEKPRPAKLSCVTMLPSAGFSSVTRAPDSRRAAFVASFRLLPESSLSRVTPWKPCLTLSNSPVARFSASISSLTARSGMAVLEFHLGRARLERPVREHQFIEAPGQQLVRRNAKPHCDDPQDRLQRPIRQRGIVLAADRKSTRLNSSHVEISYAVFCLK